MGLWSPMGEFDAVMHLGAAHQRMSTSRAGGCANINAAEERERTMHLASCVALCGALRSAHRGQLLQRQ